MAISLHLSTIHIDGRGPIDRVEVKVNGQSVPPGVSLAFVEPGRNGDILNTLPLMYALANHGYCVRPVIHPDYYQLFTGQSRIPAENCIVVDLPGRGGHRLMADTYEAWVKKYHPGAIVINSKVKGNPLASDSLCPNYNHEAYRLAGAQGFSATDMSPIDIPITAGGHSLLRHFYDGRPLVLLSTLSHSSPASDRLRRELQQTTQLLVGNYRWLKLLDMGSSEVSRILYAHSVLDMLSLYSKAVLLITVDTVTLHLARIAKGQNVPTLALVNNTPWLQSLPARNEIARFNYNELLDREDSLYNRLMPVILGQLEKELPK